MEFTDRFRIYLIKQRKMVKWSIMLSPMSTDLYLVGRDSFESILGSWRRTDGSTTNDMGFDYFVQSKKVGKDDEYVRLSVSGNSALIREYRFSPDNMTWLEKEYQRQSSDRMPWDI